MLTIRKEQIETLAAEQIYVFKTKLEADLRHCFEAAGRILDGGELRHELDQGIAAALAAAFERESDIAQYVLIIAKHFGGRWSQQLPEPARIILGAGGVSAERRLAMLDEWAHDMKGIGF